MRVLVAHNYYRQAGGEDRVFALETEMLQAHGQEVIRYVADNRSIPGLVPIHLAIRTTWNQPAYKRIRRILQDAKVSICHFHNTFPLISPAAYYAAKAEGVPVVQKIANYRLLCPAATMYRNGSVCEQCLNKAIPWPGLAHGCYRGSKLATACTATMTVFHRLVDTWSRKVDAFITPSEFTKSKLVEGGVAAKKVHVKPNFVHPDPGRGQDNGHYALYVGRLSDEKGLRTLATAWRHLGRRLPLKIVGDGPLAPLVQSVSAASDAVQWLGPLPPEQVLAVMKEAAVLIVPSEWYEVFGIVIAEAYAVGLPVIGSKIGGIASLIDHGRTGLLFEPGRVEDLMAKVDWMLSRRERWRMMRREARREFELKYCRDVNYRRLMEIYSLVIALARSRSCTSH